MMMSPETYYELHCKERLYDDLLTQARGLKKQIGHCKRILENPYSEQYGLACPGYDVQCACFYQYLEMTKKAMREQGYEYPASEKEKRAEKIDENLNNIKTVTFEIGGFLSSRTVHRIEIGEDLQYFFGSSYDAEDKIEAPFSMRKSNFIYMLKNLHIGDWKSCYYNHDILDGTQWSITLEFANGIKPIRYDGSNAYPWNFEDFASLFGEDDYKYDMI